MSNIDIDLSQLTPNELERLRQGVDEAHQKLGQTDAPDGWTFDGVDWMTTTDTDDRAMVGYYGQQLVALFFVDLEDESIGLDTEPGELHPYGHPLPVHRFAEGTTPTEAMQFVDGYVRRVNALSERLQAAGWANLDDLFDMCWRRGRGHVHVVVDFQRDEVRMNLPEMRRWLAESDEREIEEIRERQQERADIEASLDQIESEKF